MIKRGGYGRKLAYRLGLWPKLPPKKKGIQRIWIQAVSVGELSSIGKLLESLLADPAFEIVLSGTTSTGLAIAEEKYGQRLLAQGPFPLDWLPFSRLAWSSIQPDLAFAVDSELWPEHMYQAKKNGVPFIIVNARLSDRSFRRLQFFRFLHGILLPPTMRILASSEKQVDRWLSLGLDSDKVMVTGNLKVDSASKSPPTTEEIQKLKTEFGFSENSFVLVGISTWPGEEETLIDAITELRMKNLDARLLLVPRHAERREEVRKCLAASGLPFNLRSESSQAAQGTIVYLADTTGELPRLIGAGDLAFLGKTLPPNNGGQNPMEPISLGLPLIVGPAYQNFRESCAELFSQGAAFKAEGKEKAKRLICQFAVDIEKNTDAREACFEWIKRQGSPTGTTLKILQEILIKRSRI
jgi:3-deoxy-D-manno-octulosonic-acid transferase